MRIWAVARWAKLTGVAAKLLKVIYWLPLASILSVNVRYYL